MYLSKLLRGLARYLVRNSGQNPQELFFNVSRSSRKDGKFRTRIYSSSTLIVSRKLKIRSIAEPVMEIWGPGRRDAVQDYRRPYNAYLIKISMEKTSKRLYFTFTKSMPSLISYSTICLSPRSKYLRILYATRISLLPKPRPPRLDKGKNMSR
jgi:hypothetical protein